MYPDIGYKLAHAQSVCTGPFFPRREGPGDEAMRLHIIEQSTIESQLQSLEIELPAVRTL